MNDPRLTALLAIHATAPSPDATLAVQTASEALASMGAVDSGEARILLSALCDAWFISPPESLDKLASWCSKRSHAEAEGLRDGVDPLVAHLGDQAKGRYALCPWPWESLTRESRSLMPGSVTIVCGTPGASKSWFALSCLRYWISEGISASVMMLEETKKWHLQRALAQCAGDPDLLYPEWIAANREAALKVWEAHRDELAIIGTHLVCDGDLTLAQCAKWVEEQCAAKKRVIIVDPISLADPGSERAWEADRKFMARAKVAIEASGSSLVLVTHPRKAGGKAQGPPTLDDLAGGAAYGRACASALWVAGVDGQQAVNVINARQEYVQGVTPHKIVKILKARNSVGCGKTLAYTFSALQFQELGVISNTPPSDTPKQSPRKTHSATPTADEDLLRDMP